jgi:hypothetical protein
MIRIIATALLIGLAQPALSASPEDPVRSVMDLATALWSDEPSVEGQDYFDKNRLETLYSKAFVEAYRQAAKYPIFDENGGPFGYDVITNSQDGCPLEAVAVANQGEAGGVHDIKVTFKLWTCYDDNASKETVSEVHFRVVTEDGRPVIADIERMVDGKPNSLVAEMKEIAKTGAELEANPEAGKPDFE